MARFITFLAAAFFLSGCPGSHRGATQTPPHPGTEATFPIRVSDNGRYFVGKNGAAFLYHADTGWAAPWAISPAEFDEYLADRRTKGFTTIQIWAVGCDGNTPNYAGQPPFRGKPFDVRAVNESYFQNLDSIIQKAASKNAFVVVAAAWFGADGMCNRSRLDRTKAAMWGRWLGRRYKAANNVAWIMAGDNALLMDKSDMTPVARAMAKAIKAAAPHHLITLHEQGGVSSGAVVHNESWLDFNMAYDYQSRVWHEGPELYSQLQTDYRRKPVKPFVLGEGHYDWPGTEWVGFPIRRQAYWAILSGAAGHAYGQMSTMDFGSCCGVNWRDGLNAPSAISMRHLKTLLSSRAWEKLVPDLDHQIMTAGYQEGGAYAPFAMASDGSFGLAYLPNSRTVTVDMSRFAAPVRAMWFDPTNGTRWQMAGSPFVNAGSRSFTPAQTNGGGDSDWVLILER
jgi:hypothetical protein